MPRADCLDGSGGAIAGSGLAAPAPILAAMFALSEQVFGREALAASVPRGEVVD